MSDTQRNPGRICPECRYDLRAADLDEAGILTCPECGGHWTLQSLQERRDAAATKHHRLRDFGFGAAFPVVWICWLFSSDSPEGAFLGSGITMVLYLALVAVDSAPEEAGARHIASRFWFLMLVKFILAVASSVVVVLAVQAAMAFARR